MNFQLTEEQKLLSESAIRWVADRGAAAGLDGFAQRWKEIASFGWLAMMLPDAATGEAPACGLAEACVLAQAFGAGPLADPFIPAILEAATLIAHGSGAQRRQWLPAIGAGEALVVPAFAEPGAAAPLQPTLAATRTATGWRLDGRKRPVPFGARAHAWLASARGAAGEFMLFIVPRQTPGVAVKPFATVDGGEAAMLDFAAAEVGDEALLAGATLAHFEAARDQAALAACAESVGAIEALVKATIEYTRTRVQFGKPLSANQVLRHRMAEMVILQEESRAMTRAATIQLVSLAPDAAVDRARVVAATRAKVAAAARRVAEESIQLHGGMGVTEELSVGRYLRRALALEALYGSAEVHLRRLADLPAAIGGGFDRMPAHAQFREEVRAFLRQALTPEMVRASRLSASVMAEPDVGMEWHRRLYRQGWIAPAWPKEYGGTGWSLEQRWIFETECAAAGAPVLAPLGLRMAGPVIMRFGTPEQKAHYLPRLLAGEDYWCQGYSEPGSGSDLASLATRAVRDGDHYVINGTKIWTSHAHFANRMFALVRTGETTVRKHEGISFLLIDMATPGITVRPIRGISGEHEVNQVFFDDVRVPVSCRLGEEGQGWTIAKYLLEFERGGAIAAGRTHAALRRVRRLLAEGDDSGPRTLSADDALAFAAVEADLRAIEDTELAVMSTLAVGQNPGAASSLLKARWSEVHQAITRLGLRLLGPDALAWESERPLHKHDDGAVLAEAARPLLAGYLSARAFTIFGGTAEIQREIIAREWVG